MKTYNTPSTLAIRLENSCSLCQAQSSTPTPTGIQINNQGAKVISD